MAAYELQLCCLKGPETKSIQVADNLKKGKDREEDNIEYDNIGEDDIEDDRFQDDEEDEYLSLIHI